LDEGVPGESAISIPVVIRHDEDDMGPYFGLNGEEKKQKKG
jgi:hypothetical protein|tara:strand:- start:1792 stop:1914 length:123 start_codon:yes stop_codon:yes gene_type:complete